MPKVKMYSAPVQQAYQNDYATALAQQLMQQGTDTSPVTTPIGGIARAVTGIVGAYSGKKNREKYDTKEEERAAALSAMQAGLLGGNGIEDALAFAPADMQEPLMMALMQQKMGRGDLQFKHGLDLDKLGRQQDFQRDMHETPSGSTVYSVDAGDRRHEASLDQQRYLHGTPSGNALLSDTTTRRGQDMSYNMSAAKLQAELFNQAQKGNAANLTKGQEALDKEFAKEYADFTARGGYADAEKNLNQLKEARAALENNPNLTGAIIGNTPDFLKSFNKTGQQSMAVREAVEEVVQRNLRLILGAQFTQKEGERLIARAYNPKLPEAENIKRLDRLIGQIEQAAKSKADASAYFEQNGTLNGWTGRLPTMNDIQIGESDSGNVVDWNDLP